LAQDAGNGHIGFPISRHSYLEQNASAAALSLSAPEIAQLAQVFPVGVTAGTRYPEKQMGTPGI
jgi:hypothetical protein